MASVGATERAAAVNRGVREKERTRCDIRVSENHSPAEVRVPPTHARIYTEVARAERHTAATTTTTATTTTPPAPLLPHRHCHRRGGTAPLSQFSPLFRTALAHLRHIHISRSRQRLRAPSFYTSDPGQDTHARPRSGGRSDSTAAQPTRFGHLRHASAVYAHFPRRGDDIVGASGAPSPFPLRV
ncbi:hypothetical protein E2986_10638 [Frieseomelitta varia]|uniref:Uncharacterized protein n=1 Tax=Frieseomelitta varia TaxID=561572 RepID=A0A833SEN6_9HYME|nr:hypothetical protein E2986_10638 [Frieseomelitta varia]